MAESRWTNMLAGIERLERWLEDQVLFGVVHVEADPYASLEPLAARLTDDQLGGAAAAMRAWIGKVGATPDWVARLGEDLGYWHLLGRMAQQHERLDARQFAGIAFAFGYRFQAAKLDPLGLRQADRWTCVGVETGNEDALFYRRTHWRGTAPGAAGVQHTYSYGSPPPPSTLAVGEWTETSMHVYPDGLPGRLVLPEGVTIHAKGDLPHHFGSWAQQRAWQAACLRRQPWRRSFPVAIGPVRLAVARTRAGEHRVRIVDGAGEGVALDLVRKEIGADAGQAALLQVLACVGAEELVLFGELSGGKLRAMSFWHAGRMWGL